MKNITSLHLSVIIPCYNEKQNIVPLAKDVHDALAAYSHEIIVVDDNSPDGTFEVIQNAALPYVRAFKRQETPSLGGSIGYGIERATGNALVVMDSDYNHQPKYLPILVANLQYYDCVAASRFVYGGAMGHRFRHLASWLFNIGTRMITRTMITDSLFGFYALRRDVLTNLPFEKIFYGYGDYCIRLFYYLQTVKKADILQIPSVLGERRSGTANSRLLKTFCQYGLEVLKLSFLTRT